MENIVMERPAGVSGGQEETRMHLMRVLARLHEADEPTLALGIDASELEVHDILSGMVRENEVESTNEEGSDIFSLTTKGWIEYLKVLSSLYELE